MKTADAEIRSMRVSPFIILNSQFILRKWWVMVVTLHSSSSTWFNDHGVTVREPDHHPEMVEAKGVAPIADFLRGSLAATAHVPPRRDGRLEYWNNGVMDQCRAVFPLLHSSNTPSPHSAIGTACRC